MKYQQNALTTLGPEFSSHGYIEFLARPPPVDGLAKKRIFISGNVNANDDSNRIHVFWKLTRLLERNTKMGSKFA